MIAVLEGLLTPLTFGTALGCGVVAGVFFAFSTFVMPALARLPAPQGIAAMQAINVAAVSPVFMTALFGTAGACLLLVVRLVASPGPGAAHVIAAGLLYAVGTAGVTIVFNVPLNDRLARIDPDSRDGAVLWERYVRVWTRWNHLRAAAAIAASALLIHALAG